MHGQYQKYNGVLRGVGAAQMRSQRRGQGIISFDSIEKEIGKLGEVFSRFASLVARQAEVVERLDDDVEGALDDVDAGHAEIVRAQEILRGNRALFMKVFGILIFLIVAFVYF